MRPWFNFGLEGKGLHVLFIRIISEHTAAGSAPTRSSITLVPGRTSSYEPAQTPSQPGVASRVDDVTSPFLLVIRNAKGKWDYGTLVVCAREAGVM